MTNTWNNDVSNFIDICMRTLDKHAPLKKKYIRGNHRPFMNKELPKATMHRSKLRNNFLRHRFNENRKKKYSKQLNYCVSLLRRIKKGYYSNLNEKIITDNTKIWKRFTSFLSYKVFSNETITSVENNKFVNDDNETTNIINTFFLT